MNRMSRSLCTLALALIGGTVGVSRPALAGVTLYSTGFENPPFATGSQLVGQDGWTGVDFLSLTAAIIDGSAAHTGSQGVRVRGADMTPAVQVDPFFAVGSYRHQVDYVANGATTHVSVDVKLDGPSGHGGPTVFYGASLASRVSGPNGVGDTFEFQLSSEGGIFGFDDNLPSSALGGSGVLPPFPSDMNHWYHMDIATDFTAKTVSFLLDGVSLGVIPFDDPTYDTLLRGTLLVYATQNQDDFLHNDYTANFDNFSITAVPEPGIIPLVLGFSVGGIGLAAVRRRSRGVLEPPPVVAGH
jgi:hypothetical protein